MAKFLAKPIIAKGGGDEGGELLLEKADTNTTLVGTGVTIDVYQNRLRFFEQGGTARGAYIDLTAAAAGVATDLLAGGGSSVGALDDLTDVTLSSPEQYQTLVYDGSAWINEYPTTVSLVNNAESTTLQVGEVVYLYGNVGNHASVKRADNDGDATSAKTVGVVAEAISAGATGPVVTRGYVTGMNLSVGYTAGQTLYLGENGGYTTTKPYAPEHLVYVGVVVRATNNGIIYVATQNGYELDEIHDVDLITNAPASGDFLKYNGSLWVNDAINLGTDTVGNYMSDISGTSPVSVTHTPAEGSSATVSLATAYGDTQNPYGSKTANYFLASPNGSSGSPSFRAIVSADLPKPVIAVSDTAPSSPVTGNLWYKSSTGATYVYYDSYWVEIGSPSSGLDGGSA